jgi:UDP-glucuronate decarboxylase
MSRPRALRRHEAPEPRARAELRDSEVVLLQVGAATPRLPMRPLCPLPPTSIIAAGQWPERTELMMKKRILVTGGAGFLGCHLCERLTGEQHDVICLDNYYTGRRENIETLLGKRNFETLRHDITFPLYIEVDQIYNLACPASPIHYQHDPVQTTKTSVLGAINMLGLAKRLRIPILQASTSEIYGDPDVHPQPESYKGHVSISGPRACYDEGKRCAETLFYDYQRQHDLPIRVARIFNTYGPRMHPQDGRVVSNFIVQALRNEPITIYGDGSQTRAFCFVDDLVDGLLRLMNVPGRLDGAVNLGNPAEIRIIEIAETIIALTGSRSAIERRPLPEDDPRQRCPDISRARDLLRWRPKVALEEGLKRTIGYFERLLLAGGEKVARLDPARALS